MQAGGDPVLQKYARLATRYDRRWSFYVAATLRETLARLEVHEGEWALDVGCGTGALLQALRGRSPRATTVGVDASGEMLELARARLGHGCVLQRARAEALAFAAETFDVVVSSSVLHYLPEPRLALAEMYRVLRPGGRIVITDWCDEYLACRMCDWWLRLTDRGYHRTYTRAQCRELLRAAGFEEIDVERYKISFLWGLMTAKAVKPKVSPQGGVEAKRTT